MKAALCIGSSLVLLVALVIFQYVIRPRSPTCYSVREGFANLDQDRLEFCSTCCRSGPQTCDPAYQCGSCLVGVPLPPFSYSS